MVSSTPPPDNGHGDSHSDGIRSPMEAHASYRGDHWSPDRVMFHQNLETFAERVGLIVGLQGNGKITQEEAYAQIKKIWKSLKKSKDLLIDPS